MRRTPRVAATALALGLVAGGCGADAGSTGAEGAVGISIGGDPANLSPLTGTASTTLLMNRFAYDPLVNVDARGNVVSGVAETWSADLTSANFTLKRGVTCVDGTEFKASDAAAQFNYMANPAKPSPLLGLSVPVGVVATADDAANTLSLRTEQPVAFFLRMISLVPLTCAKGLASPDALISASEGTGPYRLAEAVPNDHYTYVKRPGYTWGPDGGGSESAPEKVVFKIVPNETTRANLLLAGQLDIARVNGADRRRLDAAGVKSELELVPVGQLLFNETPEHPTSDQRVRWALTAALDLKQLAAVATGGKARPSTILGASMAVPCTGDSVTPNTPPHDRERAARALTEAGWKKTGGRWTKNGERLSITLSFPAASGTPLVSAAELAAKQWSSFGVQVDRQPTTPATLGQILSAGDWDVSWTPIAVANPDMNVPFFSGPRPPEGNNFGGVDNPEYRRLVSVAATKPDTAGCAEWTAAESELAKRVDVVAFADMLIPYFTKGYTFSLDGNGLLPTSLRPVGDR
ncbi:ABC transporter substrate-binding protein [Streptomyces sp. SID3343]|uniref:ABC transporter substrate-binding protein n=1 Tax=Streptomyces sp. SID3343 TaxID=2690260 RepID=UPI00136CE0A4|nr:ABC transporter substrate-binding protein [Streptomyces sp. SID3343]MYW05881.1 ABC transporter substrate-binding protein [Streptomyces sp. SID3343]